MSKKQNGFTLIELVVVIVVLGILAIVTLPSYFDITGDAKLSSLQGALGSIRSATSMSYAENVIDDDTGGDASYWPDTITGALFQDGNIPPEPFTDSSTVKVVASAGAIAAMAAGGFDDAGGWIYNKTTGEVRANTAANRTE